MRQTVLGVFDSYADARSAQRTLGEAGVAQADIAIYSMSTDAPVEKGPRVYAPGNGDLQRRKPVFDQLEQLFARLFKRGEYPPETEDYREFIRRGGAIVSADVSEMQVDLARDLMRRTGAADIEERAKAWRNGSGEAGISEHALHQDSSTTHEFSARDEPSSAQKADTMTHDGPIAGPAPSADTTEHSSTARDPSPVTAAPRTSTSDESAAARAAMHGGGFSPACAADGRRHAAGNDAYGGARFDCIRGEPAVSYRMRPT